MRTHIENGIEMVEFKWFGNGMTPQTVKVTAEWFNRLTGKNGVLQYEKVQEYIKNNK